VKSGNCYPFFLYHVLGLNAIASIIVEFKFHLSNINMVDNKENLKIQTYGDLRLLHRHEMEISIHRKKDPGTTCRGG
jgi:hypothetical protein